jgi:HEAT repeat protein
LGLEAVPALYKLLKDSNPTVRYRAIEALNEIDTKEDINDLSFIHLLSN